MDRRPTYKGRDTVDRDPLLNALVHGERQAKATTSLARQAVRSARKMLRTQGYTKKNAHNLTRDAEIWAAVWMKYGGSLEDALRVDYDHWQKSNLSNAVALFNDALGMKLPRGRRPLPSDEDSSLLDLDYGRATGETVHVRSRDARYEPPLPASIHPPIDKCTKCEGPLEFGIDQHGSYIHCIICGTYC